MSELFPVEPSLSPKLAWLKKHRLTTSSSKTTVWTCRNNGYTRLAMGEDEATAILNYCEKYDLKHWSLE